MNYNYDLNINISEQTLNRKLTRGFGDINTTSHSGIDELKQKKYRVYLYEITDFKGEVMGVFTKENCCKFLNLSWSGILACKKRGTRVAGYYYVTRKKL